MLRRRSCAQCRRDIITMEARRAKSSIVPQSSKTSAQSPKQRLVHLIIKPIITWPPRCPSRSNPASSSDDQLSLSAHSQPPHHASPARTTAPAKEILEARSRKSRVPTRPQIKSIQDRRRRSLARALVARRRRGQRVTTLRRRSRRRVSTRSQHRICTTRRGTLSGGDMLPRSRSRRAILRTRSLRFSMRTRLQGKSSPLMWCAEVLIPLEK